MNSNPVLRNIGIWTPVEDKTALSSQYTGQLANTFHALVRLPSGDYGMVITGWGYSGWPPTLKAAAKVSIAFLAPDSFGNIAIRTPDFIADPVTNGGGSAIVADFNGDGRQDIVLLAHNESPFSVHPSTVYMANSKGSFDKIVLQDKVMAHDASLAFVDGKPVIFTSTFTRDSDGNKFADALVNPIYSYDNGFVISGSGKNVTMLGGASSTLVSSKNGTYSFAVGDAPVIKDGKHVGFSIEIYPYDPKSADVPSRSPAQIITPYLATLPEYKDFPADIVGPGVAHVYRLWSLDLNKDGFGDLMAGQSMWSQQNSNFPSALQVLINKGDGTFRDATVALNPELILSTSEMDYNPQFIDLDNSGIETLLFAGSMSWGSLARQSDYILLNDGTGRLHIGLHDEFFDLAQQVFKFLRIDPRQQSTPPRFVAVPQKDGSLDFIAEVPTSFYDDALKMRVLAYRFVNVDLSFNPTLDYKKDVTIADRNGSTLMRTWAGNDVVYDANGGAKARIDGGLGNDTAVYSGTFGQYRIFRNLDDSVSITSRGPMARLVADTLVRFETLKFADQTIAVKDLPVFDPNISSFNLIADAGFAGSIGGSGHVVGTTGAQDITVISRAGTVTFDPSFNAGGDVIRLPGKAADWTIQRTGSSAKLMSDTVAATIPIGTTANWIVFADGARSLAYKDGSFKIGSQSFGESAVKIEATSDGAAPSLTLNSDANGRLILSEGAEASIGGKVQVIGTGAGKELVEVLGGRLSFDPSFNGGGDVIDLPGNANTWSALRSGSSMLLTKGNDSVSIPIGTAGTDLAFDNAARALIFIGGQFKIGNQLIEGSSPLALIG